MSAPTYSTTHGDGLEPGAGRRAGRRAARSAAGGDREDEKALLTRFQVAF